MAAPGFRITTPALGPLQHHFEGLWAFSLLVCSPSFCVAGRDGSRRMKAARARLAASTRARGRPPRAGSAAEAAAEQKSRRRRRHRRRRRRRSCTAPPSWPPHVRRSTARTVAPARS